MNIIHQLQDYHLAVSCFTLNLYCLNVKYNVNVFSLV